MSETKFSNFTNEDGSTGPDLVGITSFTSPYYFVPPSGNTAQRPSGEGLAPGMLRFNTDIGRLEVWRADHWGTILGESPNLGISTNPPGTSGGLGTRGVFGAGFTPTPSNTFLRVIEFVTISTLGNVIDFGDLSVDKGAISACSSSTRGVVAGGYTSNVKLNVIEYITISSTGNSQVFGDLSGVRADISACSSSTRGVFGGGYTPTPATTFLNVIEYITIASTGDAQYFGDLSAGKSSLSACSSSTRGVFGGGYKNTPTASRLDVIEYITIASTGNAVDFGDLTVPKNVLAACSNGHGGL